MATSHIPLTNIGLLRLAWRIVGGWPVILRSGHFWAAFLVWLICYPAWTEPEWWKDSISVLPSLLGFTLGGFAIFLGFGSDSFKEMISAENEEKAQYLSVSAAFLMFVGIQTVGLIWAIACAATWYPTPQWLLPVQPLLHTGRFFMWGIGYFLFIYGIALSFHAALRIFRLSRWYNSFLVHSAQLQNEADAENDKAAK
jgi:hypothetical protein